MATSCPVATLAAASAYGGLVLGAFDGDRLVGFSFAFRGVLDGTPILYSQLTGVLPEAQGGGIGRRIKQWQRTWAREQGLPLVAWAFDPLQAMNAHYNLVALGAVATHYHANFYGPREDALNPGLPTDRLLCILLDRRSTPRQTGRRREIRSCRSSLPARYGGRWRSLIP